MKQVLALTFAFLTVSLPTDAQTFSVLYSFQGKTDGSNPQAGLFLNAVYGTTFLGGDPTCACGTVFELLLNGTFTTLHTFVGRDGANPAAGLVADAYGNLYGTTSQGGSFGAGTVFKLAPPATLGGTWTESVLYNFTSGVDGAHPYAGLAQDGIGNLYGTTNRGGAFNFGTLFKLDKFGNEVVLHSFRLSPDGAYPYAAVILDSAGSLYGTTNGGGAFNSGTVFKLAAMYTENVVHSFNGTTDGAYPISALTLDPTGSLFGTANQGGSGQEGTIFKLTNKGRFSVLHTFKGILQGANPAAGLILDSSGNFYGTTTEGGNLDDDGTIFELNPTTGSYTVLHAFASGNQGNYPYTGLIADSSGNLYGATESGGTARRGLLYRITIPVGRDSLKGNHRSTIPSSTEATLNTKREVGQ